MLFKRSKLTMKYFLQGSIIFLLLIMLMPSYAEVREADSTAGLHVTIDVKPNGNLIVTEQFDITAGGYIFKHGIYRRIPLLLEGRYGGEYLAGFKMLSAQLNNTSIPYQATISNGNAIIKVGDPKKELDYGPASFIITYQLSDEIRFFENYDELYFNAIPHQWATSIEKSMVVVNLPEQTSVLKYKAYTGSYTEKEDNYIVDNPVQNQFRFTATQDLGLGEGMTIVLALPKDIIDQPSVFYFIFLLDFLEWILLITFSGTVGGFVYWSWRKVGIYPDENVDTPDITDVPSEISPAIINYILNHAIFSNSTMRDLTSASTHLAIKGYLGIKYEYLPSDSGIKEGSFYTHTLTLSLKTNLPNTPLPKNEQCILDWVIKQGGSYQVSRENRKKNRELFKLFSSAISKDLKATSIFTWNIKYTLFTVALSSVFVSLQLIFGVSDWTDILWGPLVILMTAPVCIIWLAIYESIFEDTDGNVEPQWEKKCLLICITWLPWMWLLCSFVPLLSISMAFLLLLSITALSLNRGPSQYGKPLLVSSMQIRKYISAKKLPEDDLLLTETEYEKFLPYAISLDLHDEWCARFDNVLRFKRGQFRKQKRRKKKKISESLNPYRYTPMWFSGGFSDQTEFLNCVDGMSYSALGNSSVSSSMSSSGFSSSGGFSGGGGGGGGGGGW